MGKTNFRKISNKAAMQAALKDMKEEKINYSLIWNQSLILEQPVITTRMGLFGL